jgi:uncharacterized membrane protein
MILKRRHVAKAISWRIIGSIDSLLIAWLVTGSFELGAILGGAKLVTATVWYYMHERIWYKYIKFGITNKQSNDYE